MVALIGRYTDALDEEALAAALLGGVVNYRRSDWTFDGPALDVEEDRFIDVWGAAAYAAITGNHREDDHA